MMSMASKAADELSDLQRFQDKAVGLVYNRCVQRGQIDARGVSARRGSGRVSGAW